MQKTKKNFKKTFLLPLLLAVFGLGVFQAANALTEAEINSMKLKVSGEPHRISHPAYTMNQTWPTMRHLFNVDHTRVMMFEYGVRSGETGRVLPHPGYSAGLQRAWGRGWIWGYVDTLVAMNLDSASGDASLINWDNNTFDIPGMADGEANAPKMFALTPIWSPYTGEPNLIYALCITNSGICAGYDNDLIIYNVDTEQVVRSIIDIGIDVVDTTFLMGFARDAAVVGSDHEDIIIVSVPMWSSDSTIVIDTKRRNNFVSPTKDNSALPKTCDAINDWAWYPKRQRVHESLSPDGLYYSASSGRDKGVGKVDNDETNCANYEPGVGYIWQANRYWTYMGDNDPYWTHTDWDASNDWFMAGDIGAAYTYPTAPNIDASSEIRQVFFNRALAEETANGECPSCFTVNTLINRVSAGVWTEQNGSYVNYSNLPSPTIDNSGSFLHFQGTNGKSTREDYDLNPAKVAQLGQGWEGQGTYIAFLISPEDNPADVNGDKSVNIKDIQACVKVITGIDTTYREQCKVLADPTDTVSIKDIQVIVSAIVNR